MSTKQNAAQRDKARAARIMFTGGVADGYEVVIAQTSHKNPRMRWLNRARKQLVISEHKPRFDRVRAMWALLYEADRQAPSPADIDQGEAWRVANFVSHRLPQFLAQGGAERLAQLSPRRLTR